MARRPGGGSMSNRVIDAAVQYHSYTKHSYDSVHTSQHYLDWDNRPLPLKIYATLAPISLPREAAPLSLSALAAISVAGAAPSGAAAVSNQAPDLDSLARLFFLSNGVHRVRTFGDAAFRFRTASCTGALYHIELYVVCGDLPGLAAGVYHYGAHDHALRRLREGDYRELIVGATAAEPAVAQAPAVVICTDTFWRNAWKYQAREYRHAFWDNGVILANLLAATAALDLPARVACGFVDEEVNQLLSLDTAKEVAVSLVALGWDQRPIPAAPALPTSLPLETAPLSKYEVDYPLIREMHAASSLAATEVASWRGETPKPQKPAPSGQIFPLAPLPETKRSADATDVVILRRGSARRFARASISFAQLSAVR